MALRLVLRVTKELAAREARTGRMLLLGRVGCLRHRRHAVQAGEAAGSNPMSVHALAAVAAVRVSHTVLVEPNKVGASVETTRHLDVGNRRFDCGDLLVKHLLILLEIPNSGCFLLTSVPLAQLRDFAGQSGTGRRGLPELGRKITHRLGSGGSSSDGGGGSGSGGGGSSSGSGVGGGSSGSGTTTIGLAQQLLHLLRHLAVGHNLVDGGGDVLHGGNEVLCDLIGGHDGVDDLHDEIDLVRIVVGLNQCVLDRIALLGGRTSGLLEDLLQEFLGGLNDEGDHRDDLPHVPRDSCCGRHDSG